MKNIKQSLEENSYVILEKVLPDEICEGLKRRVHELVQNHEDNEERSIFSTLSEEQERDRYFLDSCDKVHFFWEEEAFNEKGDLLYEKEKAINKIGHGLHLHEPCFKDFSESTFVKEIIEETSYFKEAVVAQSMYIFKQPKIGGEVTCHQDSTFIHTNPSQVLGLWVALEDADKENGCLYGIPGSYKKSVDELFVLKGQNCGFRSKERSLFPIEKAIPLEVKKGTIILFDGSFPHFSYSNRSAKSRQALTLHYIDKKNAYLKTNWNQSKHLL